MGRLVLTWPHSYRELRHTWIPLPTSSRVRQLQSFRSFKKRQQARIRRRRLNAKLKKRRQAQEELDLWAQARQEEGEEDISQADLDALFAAEDAWDVGDEEASLLGVDSEQGSSQGYTFGDGIEEDFDYPPVFVIEVEDGDIKEQEVVGYDEETDVIEYRSFASYATYLE